METAVIYETLLGLPSLQIASVVLEKSKLFVDYSVKQPHGKCPICGSESTVVNQSYTRRLCDLNISNWEVYLQVKARQFFCNTCTKYFNEVLDFADAYKSHRVLS